MGSEWTVENLKEYIERVLLEKDKAINAALTAAKEAVQVAEVNAEKWRASANEWRSAMNDREKKFPQREEVDIRFLNMQKEIQVLQKIIWGGLGALATVQFLFQYFVK